MAQRPSCLASLIGLSALLLAAPTSAIEPPPPATDPSPAPQPVAPQPAPQPVAPQPPSPGEPQASQPAASDKGGFYLRLSLGPAWHYTSQTQRIIGGEVKTHVGGNAIDGHLMAGWRYHDIALVLSLSMLTLPEGQRIERDASTTVAVVNPSVQLAPLGKTPSWTRATVLGVGANLTSESMPGAHVQGTIGYASLPGFRASIDTRDYVGVGLSAAVGYDAWRLPGLRAGLLAQVQLLGLSDTQSAGNGNDSVSATLVSFSLMASAAFH